MAFLSKRNAMLNEERQLVEKYGKKADSKESLFEANLYIG